MSKQFKHKMMVRMHAVFTIPLLTGRRFLFLFLLGTQLFTFAVAGESVSVKLKLSNTTVLHVIELLQQQTGYEFSYNSDILSEKLQTVSVDRNNEDIEVILAQVFRMSDVSFMVVDNRVFLKKKNVEKEAAEEKKIVQQAPERRIIGVIKDASGETIIGATVVEKGDPANGTITDVDGAFVLDVKQGAIIVISYVGYISQEKNTTTSTSFEIVLQEDTKTLDEVVVVGYGT